MLDFSSNSFLGPVRTRSVLNEEKVTRILAVSSRFWDCASEHRAHVPYVAQHLVSVKCAVCVVETPHTDRI